MDKTTILNALKKIQYPGFTRDIVSFGIVRSVDVAEDGQVSLALDVTTSDNTLADRLRAEITAALRAIGCAEPRVAIASRPAPTPAAPASAPQPQAIPGVRHIVAVASGKGGVGKSTLAVNLACALARESPAGTPRIGLLDCDFHGPSIPLMTGLHDTPEALDNTILPLEKYGLKIMSLGFLVDSDAPVIWRGPMIMKTMQQFARQVAWGDLDVLVVDLPPGTGDAPLSLVQTVPVDGVVIVTTPQAAAASVALRGAGLFGRVGAPVLGVVENMSHEVFGTGGGETVANALGVEFLGQIPLDIAVREGGDSGVPVVIAQPQSPPAKAFAQIAERLREALGA